MDLSRRSRRSSSCNSNSRRLNQDGEDDDDDEPSPPPSPSPAPRQLRRSPKRKALRERPTSQTNIVWPYPSIRAVPATDYPEHPTGLDEGPGREHHQGENVSNVNQTGQAGENDENRFPVSSSSSSPQPLPARSPEIDPDRRGVSSKLFGAATSPSLSPSPSPSPSPPHRAAANNRNDRPSSRLPVHAGAAARPWSVAVPSHRNRRQQQQQQQQHHHQSHYPAFSSSSPNYRPFVSNKTTSVTPSRTEHDEPHPRDSPYARPPNPSPPSDPTCDPDLELDLDQLLLPRPLTINAPEPRVPAPQLAPLLPPPSSPPSFLGSAPARHGLDSTAAADHIDTIFDITIAADDPSSSPAFSRLSPPPPPSSSSFSHAFPGSSPPQLPSLEGIRRSRPVPAVARVGVDRTRARTGPSTFITSSSPIITVYNNNTPTAAAPATGTSTSTTNFPPSAATTASLHRNDIYDDNDDDDDDLLYSDERHINNDPEEDQDSPYRHPPARTRFAPPTYIPPPATHAPRPQVGRPLLSVPPRTPERGSGSTAASGLRAISTAASQLSLEEDEEKEEEEEDASEGARGIWGRATPARESLGVTPEPVPTTGGTAAGASSASGGSVIVRRGVRGPTPPGFYALFPPVPQRITPDYSYGSGSEYSRRRSSSDPPRPMTVISTIEDDEDGDMGDNAFSEGIGGTRSRYRSRGFSESSSKGRDNIGGAGGNDSPVSPVSTLTEDARTLPQHQQHQHQSRVYSSPSRNWSDSALDGPPSERHASDGSFYSFYELPPRPIAAELSSSSSPPPPAELPSTSSPRPPSAESPLPPPPSSAIESGFLIPRKPIARSNAMKWNPAMPTIESADERSTVGGNGNGTGTGTGTGGEESSSAGEGGAGAGGVRTSGLSEVASSTGSGSSSVPHVDLSRLTAPFPFPEPLFAMKQQHKRDASGSSLTTSDHRPSTIPEAPTPSTTSAGATSAVAATATATVAGASAVADFPGPSRDLDRDYPAQAYGESPSPSITPPQSPPPTPPPILTSAPATVRIVPSAPIDLNRELPPLPPKSPKRGAFPATAYGGGSDRPTAARGPSSSAGAGQTPGATTAETGAGVVRKSRQGTLFRDSLPAWARLYYANEASGRQSLLDYQQRRDTLRQRRHTVDSLRSGRSIRGGSRGGGPDVAGGPLRAPGPHRPDYDLAAESGPVVQRSHHGRGEAGGLGVLLPPPPPPPPFRPPRGSASAPIPIVPQHPHRPSLPPPPPPPSAGYYGPDPAIYARPEDPMDLLPSSSAYPYGRADADYDQRHHDQRNQPGRAPGPAPAHYTPHLYYTRGSVARRRSVFLAPSIDESLERRRGMVFTRRNAQVWCFALGFVLPPFWAVAAFLPLPPRPRAEEDPYAPDGSGSGSGSGSGNGSGSGGGNRNGNANANADADGARRPNGGGGGGAAFERDLEKTLGPRDVARFENARWWRNVNRVMAVIGIGVIAAIIVLAVAAAKTSS